MQFSIPLLAFCACILARIVAANIDTVYARSPWTGEGDFVSLETHPDGTPFEPVPGDGGLCGALTTEVENFTVVALYGATIEPLHFLGGIEDRER